MGSTRYNRRARWTATGLVLGAILIAASGCGSGAGVVRSTSKFPTDTGFTHHEMTVDGKTRNVWVFVPKDYRPGKQYPAILFLHGLFESGDGYDKCVSAGLGPVIAKDPEKWPFITIFPQSDGTWRGEDRERVAMAALDLAEKNWTIDRDRIVLAGLSYGGLGTWEIGARNPERFSALVPVSGLRATELAEQLTPLPVWAFAYRGDPWVQSQSSADMCREIQERGGQARLTQFAGMGHDCWDKAVAESSLVDWMLVQRRQASPTLIRTASTPLAGIE